LNQKAADLSLASDSFKTRSESVRKQQQKKCRNMFLIYCPIILIIGALIAIFACGGPPGNTSLAVDADHFFVKSNIQLDISVPIYLSSTLPEQDFVDARKHHNMLHAIRVHASAHAFLSYCPNATSTKPASRR